MPDKTKYDLKLDDLNENLGLPTTICIPCFRSPLLPGIVNRPIWFLQTPNSQIGEALSKGEWQDL